MRVAVPTVPGVSFRDVRPWRKPASRVTEVCLPVRAGRSATGLASAAATVVAALSVVEPLLPQAGRMASEPMAAAAKAVLVNVRMVISTPGS